MDKRLKIMDADTLLSTPLEMPWFVVEGLIPQGVTLLGGASKIGKSWLMLWLGLQISQGLPVWEMETAPCDVLYLCLEDTFVRIQNRLYHLTESAPENLRFAVMSSRIGDGLEQELMTYLSDYPGTKLLIIDTLQRVRDSKSTSGNGGMYGSDYQDITAVKQIADQFDISVILVHHVRKLKDSDDPFNELTGSTGITGAVDTSFVLKKDGRSADTATLLATGRDIAYQQLTLRFQNRIWQLVERKDGEALQKEDTPPFLFALVRFMEARPQWQGTATELLAEMEEQDISPNAVTKLLSHFCYEILQPSGIVYQTKRTGKSRLIRLKRNDDCDANDGNSPIAVSSSQPSCVVTATTEKACPGV